MRRTPEKMLKQCVNLMNFGRPADPRDIAKWNRAITESENLLEELPSGDFRDHSEEAFNAELMCEE